MITLKTYKIILKSKCVSVNYNLKYLFNNLVSDVYIEFFELLKADSFKVLFGIAMQQQQKIIRY